MALILNIETSGNICSVCLANNENVVDFRESKEQNSHARLLTVLIDDLLAASKISFKEIDAVAVSAGPGSYTGLRIGVSVAKGLCYALNKPLIAVHTLLSVAEGIKQKVPKDASYFMSVIDARRMDAYTAIYDNSGNEILKTACITITEEFENHLSSFDDIHIGGNALAKCKGIFKSSRMHFIENVDCDSRLMAKLSGEKYRQNVFEDSPYFEPYYLKEFLPKNVGS